MEFWALKMLILLKFLLFISSMLDMFSYVLCSHLVQIQKNHSYNFLQFCGSMTNMIGICLLWPSANSILLWELVAHVKLWGLDM